VQITILLLTRFFRCWLTQVFESMPPTSFLSILTTFEVAEHVAKLPDREIMAHLNGCRLEHATAPLSASSNEGAHSSNSFLRAPSRLAASHDFSIFMSTSGGFGKRAREFVQNDFRRSRPPE